MKNALRALWGIVNFLVVCFGVFVIINPEYFEISELAINVIAICGITMTIISVLWLLIWAMVTDARARKAKKECCCCQEEKTCECEEEKTCEEIKESPAVAVVEEEVIEKTTEEEKPAEEPTEETVEEVLVEEEPVVEETVVEEEIPAEEQVVEEEPVQEPVVEDKDLIGLFDHEYSEVLMYEGLISRVASGWKNFFKEEAKKEYWDKTMAELKNAYETKNVYPAKENLLKAFELTDLENVRVVILGKIPYYRKNQADGLAYSSEKSADINAATSIVIKEAVDDVKIKEPNNGSLVNWAKHGVFLFNTVLTAPSDKPANHQKMWKQFSDDVIDLLINHHSPKVFILWGEHAKEYAEKIKANPNHLVLEAPNPSPLSAMNGFYGSKPYSQANEFLLAHGYKPVNWEL